MLKKLHSLLSVFGKSKAFYGILVLLFVQVLLTTAIPYLLGQILDKLNQPGQFFQLLVVFGSFVLLTSLIQVWAPRLYNRLIESYVANLRQAAVNKVQALPISQIDRLGKGDLLSRITVDSQQLNQGLTLIFSQLLPGGLTIVLTLVMMLRMNLLMTLLVVGMSPLSILMSKGLAKWAYQTYQAQTKSRGDLVQFLSERIDQLTLVQATNAQATLNQDFQALNQTYADQSLRAIFLGSTINPLTRFVNALIYAGLVALGLSQLLAGRMTLGNLTSFLTYVTNYTKPFNDISSVFAELQATQACLDRLRELLALPEKGQSSDQALTEFEGRVDFEGVSFGYQAGQSLMTDLTLHIPVGSMIGIVGPTGAGKSTLINLLMRYYQPNQGRILLDNQPIDQISPSDFYNHIAVVLQDTWLKKVSVADNIAYGRPDASREEIMAAAKAANADFFIRQLPQGYDTILDKSLISLSQGQEQLLAIARVFLKSPKILVFDEATSSLDTLTERLVQDATQKLMDNRTSFIIAHRLSTIRDADIILVMQDGDVVEQGNHEDLLAQNGLYARMVKVSEQG